MSGETPAPDPPPVQVFEIDRDRVRLHWSLFSGPANRRIQGLGILLALLIVPTICTLNLSVGLLAVIAFLAFDGYMLVQRHDMRRRSHPSMFIRDGVLVFQRTMLPDLRLPLNTIEGVGVRRLQGENRILLLRGLRLWTCPPMRENDERVARRIAERVGVERVVRIDGRQLAMHWGFILAVAYIATMLVGSAQSRTEMPIALRLAIGTIGVGLIPLAWWWSASSRRERWYACRNCKHDLRGIPDDRCPKCGEYQ